MLIIIVEMIEIVWIKLKIIMNSKLGQRGLKNGVN